MSGKKYTESVFFLRLYFSSLCEIAGIPSNQINAWQVNPAINQMYTQSGSEFLDKRNKPSLGVSTETTERSGGIMKGNEIYEKSFTYGGQTVPLRRITMWAGNLVQYFKAHSEKARYFCQRQPGPCRVQQECPLNPDWGVLG